MEDYIRNGQDEGNFLYGIQLKSGNWSNPDAIPTILGRVLNWTNLEGVAIAPATIGWCRCWANITKNPIKIMLCAQFHRQDGKWGVVKRVHLVLKDGSLHFYINVGQKRAREQANRHIIWLKRLLNFSILSTYLSWNCIAIRVVFTNRKSSFQTDRKYNGYTITGSYFVKILKNNDVADSTELPDDVKMQKIPFPAHIKESGYNLLTMYK